MPVSLRTSALALPVLAVLALQACLTDSKSGKKAVAPVEKPGRPHKAPVPIFTTLDSVVSIRIQGSRAGEEAFFWIYRNDSLLPMPDYMAGTEGGPHQYRLVDSLPGPGDYRYHVRYGSDPDSLGEKSAPFTYAWAGPSRSGRIDAMPDPQGFPWPFIRVEVPAGEIALGIRLERRLGRNGKSRLHDSILAPPSDLGYTFIDTEFVAADTVIYYRASLFDGVSEKWLPPTAWDSVTVRNRVWVYAPDAGIRNLGTEVRADISNPAIPEDPVYYLYRNTVSARAGGVRVDSAATAGQFSNPVLVDIPDAAGAYFYWIEAVDRWGRKSVRSIPVQVQFTGRMIGPRIVSLVPQNGGFLLQFPAIQESNAAYAVLRAQDTAQGGIAVDTVYPGWNGPTAYDSPPATGYWWYRILPVGPDAGPADPGPWARSPWFTYAPLFSSMPASILNRGDRVDGIPDFFNEGFCVLYRSRYSTGRDSTAVDTLHAGHWPLRLSDKPPLGAWYYRIHRYGRNEGGPPVIYRSDLVRVDFTGKVPGPAVLSLTVYGPHVAVSIQPSPDALAYILERSRDGKEWAACDTVPAGNLNGPYINDRPPEDGYWHYRARALMQEGVSDPGAPMRTPREFKYGESVSATLSPSILNDGVAVTATLSSPTSTLSAHLMRGPTPDFKNGIRVDSDSSGFASSFSFRDVPPKGRWWYWVELIPRYPGEYSLFRSAVPEEIDFTGTPGIHSLAKVSSGIRLTYARVALEDTLEVWRGTGDAADTSAYALVLSLPAGDFADYTIDSAFPRGKPAVFNYRLQVRRESGVSGLSAAKSIYWEP